MNDNSISWSIYDPNNPKSNRSDTHIIMLLIIRVIDYLFGLFNWLTSFIPKIVTPFGYCFDHNNNNHIKRITNSFSGDFFELVDLGIFRYLLNLARIHRTKPYVKFRLCTKKFILILDTELTKLILKSKIVKRGLAYEKLTTFFGYGIFTSWDQDRWQHQKNIGLVLLHGLSLKSMSFDMYKITCSDANRYCSMESIDAVLMTSQIGLYIFCDCVLGVDVRDIGEDLAPKINEILAHINGALEPFDIPFTSTTNRYNSNVKFVHNWMSTVLDRVKKSAYRNIFIDELLKLDSKQQIELMISMVLGGHETSGRVIFDVLYEINKNRAYFYRIRKEADKHFAKRDNMDHDDVFYSGNFDFLRAILMESLRMYPPVWLLSRTPTSDLVTKFTTIKKDTIILLSPLIIQRQEELWPNAEVFDPDRFLSQPQSQPQPQSQSQSQPQPQLSDTFFPFALGNEKCPAEKFAIMEPMIIIAALVRNFDIEFVDRDIPTPRPMSAGTFRLFDQLYIRMRRRQH